VVPFVLIALQAAFEESFLLAADGNAFAAAIV
jgi:hypothetical protein